MKIKVVILLLLTSLTCFSQNGNRTIDEIYTQLSQHENASYFEVTKEMFKMLSEAKETSPEFKDYISKLHNLKLIKVTGDNRQSLGNEFYHAFILQVNLKDYSILMTKKEGQDRLSFYKKEGKNENEYLLISTNMTIYIAGTINLKSLGEFEQVMDIAGSAFDM
ncbi:protein of unknown function [Tangfeifania diversioriginum]|uniref:DUF4252 domain-containing protein n=1 Tax=Tangfeifania diversioriginum TaxID=1168035 RepID=A0A1M6G5I6_9BACT|nr:DUF4252 domain-containing protein [Tangfeifania diversioriginum]SHJ05140.1 protein of unknown function [Tangfeifania diversioriginum]